MTHLGYRQSQNLGHQPGRFSDRTNTVTYEVARRSSRLAGRTPPCTTDSTSLSRQPMQTTSTARRLTPLWRDICGVDLTPGFNSTRAAVPFADLFRPGKLIETERLNVSLGESVANTGLATAAVRARVELMGCVGAMRWVTSPWPGSRKPACLMESDETAGRERLGWSSPRRERIASFWKTPGCNRSFTADDIDYAVVGQSRLFHFWLSAVDAGLWTNGGAELQKLLGTVRERGVANSLAMTLPDPDSPAGRPIGRHLAATLPSWTSLCPASKNCSSCWSRSSMPASWRKTTGGT